MCERLDMKLLMLLGSGISLSSGIPDVKNITNSILEGDWWRYTGATGPYCKGPSPQQPVCSGYQFVRSAKRLMKVVKTYADQYLLLKRRSAANYEDIACLIQQIYDEEWGEIDNPAVSDFVCKVKSDYETSILEDFESGKLDEGESKEDKEFFFDPVNQQRNFKEISRETLNFIRYAVASCIADQESRRTGLDLISDLAKDDKIERLDIFTLNHDCLVEQQLQDESVKFSDGFADRDGTIRFYDPRLYDRTEPKTRIFKLHGSVDWLYLRDFECNQNISRYGIYSPDGEDSLTDSSGNKWERCPKTPVILAGTYTKMLEYGFGIVAEMHYRFHQALQEHDCMVMSGYGWNDRGINGRLIEWLYSSRVNRLFLLHETPEDLKKSKSALYWAYEELSPAGRIISIRKWLQDVSLEKLLKSI
jgi:NAD-dependent SIR2 family protein deacetylase